MARILLPIHRRFFFDSKCYQRGVIQAPVGVQVHSTGANNPFLRRYVQPDDGILGDNVNHNSHNNPSGNVCANAYIGKTATGDIAIYQTLPWNMRCWLSGSGKNGNANNLGFAGFEVCEDNLEDQEYFDKAVKGAAVHLTAYLCTLFGFHPWDVVANYPTGTLYAVEDHAELHRLGLASDHADITKWLKHYGYTLADFRGWVGLCLIDNVVEAKYIDSEAVTMNYPILRLYDTGPSVTLMQTLLGEVGETVKASGEFDRATENAVKHFQRVNGLQVDGVCGPKTWEALNRQTAHETESDNTGADADTLETLLDQLGGYPARDVFAAAIKKWGGSTVGQRH